MKKTKTQKFIVLNELIANFSIKKVKGVKNLSAVISNLRKDGVVIDRFDKSYSLSGKNKLKTLEKLSIKYSK